MSFEHNGIEITVTSGGYFQATVEEITQRKQTLSEIREWIDKEIAANVKTITISLPVCAIAIHKDDAFSNGPRLHVARTEATGVNRQTGVIQCKATPEDCKWQTILPDSDENFTLCKLYVDAKRSFCVFQRAVSVLQLDAPGSRIDAANYKAVLDRLAHKHQEKVALGAKVHEGLGKWKAENAPDPSLELYKTALEQISRLWPEPPYCAKVDPEWVGERDDKTRSILLKAALEIARTALGKTCGV